MAKVVSSTKKVVTMTVSGEITKCMVSELFSTPTVQSLTKANGKKTSSMAKERSIMTSKELFKVILTILISINLTMSGSNMKES